MRGFSKDEKSTLLRFIDDDAKTAQFAAGDRGPQNLLHKGILTVAEDSTGYFAKFGFFYYTIDDAAFKYLKKHPELLK